MKPSWGGWGVGGVYLFFVLWWCLEKCLHLKNYNQQLSTEGSMVWAIFGSRVCNWSSDKPAVFPQLHVEEEEKKEEEEEEEEEVEGGIWKQ